MELREAHATLEDHEIVELIAKLERLLHGKRLEANARRELRETLNSLTREAGFRGLRRPSRY